MRRVGRWPDLRQLAKGERLMYSVILSTMLLAGGEAPAWGWSSCHGCCGGCWSCHGCCGYCHGCCGGCWSCHGCCGYCHGCCGGCWSSCHGCCGYCHGCCGY